MSRRLAPARPAVALVAAAGLLAAVARAGAAEVRAAAPGLTIVTDARYDVQPDAAPRPGHGRHGPDQPPARHDDEALLLRSRVPVGPARHLGLQADLVGRRARRARRSRRRPRPTRSSSSTSRRRLYSGKSATYRLVFDLVDPGGDRDRATSGSARRSRRSRSGPSPPTRRRAARSGSSSRPATRSRSSRARSRRRPTAPTASRPSRPASSRRR